MEPQTHTLYSGHVWLSSPKIPSSDDAFNVMFMKALLNSTYHAKSCLRPAGEYYDKGLIIDLYFDNQLTYRFLCFCGPRGRLPMLCFFGLNFWNTPRGSRSISMGIANAALVFTEPKRRICAILVFHDRGFSLPVTNAQRR